MRISDWSSDVCSSDLHEEAGLRIQLPEPVANLANIALLAGRIDMMATRLERGFDGGQPESDERDDGIADDLGALECFSQSFDDMFGLDNLIGCRFQANAGLFHHFLDALGVARAGGDSLEESSGGEECVSQC